MRTTQYVFILVSQVLLLCAIFAFGDHVISMAPEWNPATNPSELGRPPTGEENSLRQYLSR